MKKKHKKLFKRYVSFFVSLSAIASFATVLPAAGAEDTEQSEYPYVIFAENADQGIEVETECFTINGNGFTNGTYTLSSTSGNCNGGIVSAADVSEDEESDDVSYSKMIYLHSKLIGRYFGESCQTYSESQALSDMNVHVNDPMYVKGSLNVEGNTSLNASVGAITDITIEGETLNANNSAIYSKFGDISIKSAETSVSGIIYAPFGTVSIDCNTFNINGLIIAQNVIINGTNVSLNYNYDLARFVGTKSEAINWCFDDFKYLEDTDGDYLPDPIEKAFESDPLAADTDGDTLPDGYEVIALSTSPVKADTNNNGISDNDEDFDADGLTNGMEYEKKTDPFCSDTDGDTLIDGDEISIYGTDPLVVDTDGDGLEDPDEIYFDTDPNVVDTDGNGISDGDEKRSQVLTHEAENKESAVTEVTVAMSGTGNLNRNMQINSVMNKDVLCSEVVGLVGEPFSIETTSEFDKATLTFTIDQSKLGDTSFDDLLFLWHDEENHNFQELETFFDEENSKVYIETTHFSRYMVVDRNKWFEAWAVRFNYNPNHDHPSAPNLQYNTVLAIDCSGSMYTNDPFVGSGTSSSCERINASAGFINNMNPTDKAAIVLFDSYAQVEQDLTSSKDLLIAALSSIRSSGGTNFNQAITKSVNVITSDHTPSINGEDRVILLSDGESSVSNTTLDQAKNNHIKIHTVGLGSYSDDNLLKYISEYTGGTFYKALKADELVEIYSEIGFNDDFDKTDTDGDGLYDAVEAAGIRLENGTVIKGCDPTLKDTDGDGLDDGMEINPEIQKKDAQYYPASVPDSVRDKTYYFIMRSNPTLKDTDNDGLNDGYVEYKTVNGQNTEIIHGNRIYYNGKVIAPIDVQPLKYNGPSGMWKQHIANVSRDNIPTDHDHWYGLSESLDFIGADNILYDEVQSVIAELNSCNNNGIEGPLEVLPVLLVALCIKYPDLVVEVADKFMEVYNDLDFYRVCISHIDTDYLYQKIRDFSVTEIYETAVNWMSNNVDGIGEQEARDICAALGAAFLNFRADRNNVVHSQYYQWQYIGGFNNFYDRVFDWATNGNMRREKFQFYCGDTDYIFWLWRGNYINIGAGCEIGIYKRAAGWCESSDDGIDHYFCDLDSSIPMNLCLYNYSSGIENIFSWKPVDLQWWVTGFNPAYAGNVNAGTQVSVGTIDMSSKPEMFEEMYKKYSNVFNSLSKYVYFDKATYTVFFMWCDSELLNVN